jgi:phospholipid/cholesterol/gamma-HCH transport system ATP-binding protein
MTGEPMADPMIAVRDLSIGWSRDEVLLEHASFEVLRGEIFGILGRSAAGKSTLFRVLVGLEPPLAGEVAIAGNGPPRLAAGRPEFGVMFQQGALISSLTVGENVALPLAHWTELPRDAIRALVTAKLRLVGMGEAEHLVPAELSGGMRKRVSLARALISNPEVVLFDEPTTGLDPVSARRIDRLIRELAGSLGVTAVVVSHDPPSMFGIADRIALLYQGAVHAVATPGALRASPDPIVQQFISGQSSGPMETPGF